jgi:hypothetical protein
MKYNSHPIATDAAGRCTYFSPEYQHRRVMLDNFFIFHYGYSRADMDAVMEDKRAYYEKELAKHGGANKAFDQKVDAWFDKTEPVLTFEKEFHPEAIKSHPSWDLQRGDLNVQGNWRDASPYKEALANEPYGNIWLCMTRQAQPHMGFYHNGMDVSYGDVTAPADVVDLERAKLLHFGSCNIVSASC